MLWWFLKSLCLQKCSEKAGSGRFFSQRISDRIETGSVGSYPADVPALISELADRELDWSYLKSRNLKQVEAVRVPRCCGIHIYRQVLGVILQCFAQEEDCYATYQVETGYFWVNGFVLKRWIPARSGRLYAQELPKDNGIVKFG